VQIVAESFFDARVSTPAVDLRVTGETRTDNMAKVIARELLTEFAGEFGTFGPRSDKTHVAAKNIPELRKFVEAETAKIMTHSCAAGIVRNRPDGTEMALGILMHAAEFHDRETMAVQSDASLAIENRSAVR